MWMIGRRVEASCLVAIISGILPACTTEPSEPDTVQIIAGNHQTDTIGAVLPVPLQIRVTSARSRAVVGVAVRWEAGTPQAGNVSPELTATDRSGQAQAAWALGTTSGLHQVRADVSGLSPAVFDGAVKPGAPSAVTKTGSGQAGLYGTTLPQPLALRVTDRAGNPVSGVSVSWAQAVGAQLQGAAPATDSDGRASATLRLDSVPASGTIVATAGSLRPDSFPFTGYGYSAWLAAGNGHTCALTVRGEAYCWGDNLPAGALGDGSTIRRARSAPVSGGLKFARLWAGGHTTCAVDSLGTPYCWGENTYGQMGLGTTAPAQLVPVRAAGSLLFTQMAVGERNICGITPGAAAYCAGENQSGQLGDGDSVMKTVQTPVAGGHSFQSIAVSVWHTCGLNNLNAIYCWGWPSYWGSPSAGVQRTPTLAGAGYAFRAITLGLWFVCGVSTASKGYCWGIGTSGQLGTGDPGESSPALVLASWAFQSVDATGSATACAIAASGAAYCWGANQWGQIGDGTTTTRWIPQPVLGGLTLSRVAVGVAHVCGVTPSGKVYCWGNNNTGALGNGVMGVDRWAPVAVLPPER